MIEIKCLIECLIECLDDRKEMVISENDIGRIRRHTVRSDLRRMSAFSDAICLCDMLRG